MSPRTMMALVVLVVAGAVHADARQQSVDGITFPDVARVRADYPDDADQFIAFDLLFNRLNEVRRGTQVRGTYQLSSAYLSARNEIQSRYEQQGRASEPYAAFTARSQRLFSDPTFRQSVYEKYGLVDLPARGSATSSGPGGFVLFPERPGDRSDAEIKAAFYEALPVWGATILGMIGLMWVLMRSAGDKTAKTAPPDSTFGLPQLPEHLRRVSVAGRRYDVAMTSGQVMNADSSSGPGSVRVRTPDGREESLALTGAQLGIHAGNVISVIARSLPDGSRDILVAFNHATDQLELFQGLDRAHKTRFLGPLIVVALAGSIPGAFGLGILFHRLGGLSGTNPNELGPPPLALSLLVLWIMGAVASTIVAAFMAVRTKVKVEAGRTESVAREYLPAYRQFLHESTPTITRHFAATRNDSPAPGPLGFW